MLESLFSALSRFIMFLAVILAAYGVLAYGKGALKRNEGAALQAAQRPAAEDEPLPKESDVQTPIVRSLLDTLSKMDSNDASDDERRMIREQLLRADRELAPVLGENSQELIMKANRRLPAVRVARPDGKVLPPPRAPLAPGARGVSGVRPAQPKPPE